MSSPDKIFNKLEQAIHIIDVIYRYKQYMEEIPAMAAGIIYKDKVLFVKGYGFADQNKQIKTTGKTCYRIASISKIFTATAIMQLVEAGKINLDEKISVYLPWFVSSVDQKISNITVRQLLTHTSSISRDGDTLHWIENEFPDLKHIEKYISNLKLSFNIRSRWKYSNFGYSILGALIEQVSEKTYEEYIQENICKRLDMTLTSSKLTEQIKKHLAVGWSRKIRSEARKTFPDIETNAMASATGLSSNVGDLLKFISSFFVGNTTLLSEKSKKEMYKLHWINKKDAIRQAIGFRVFRMGGKMVYSHSGGFQGYRCNISIDLKRSIGVVTLTNVTGIEPRNYAKRAFDVINYIAKKRFVKNNETLNKYEGVYHDIWEDQAVMVIGNDLIDFDPNYLEPLSHSALLEPVKDNVFLVKGGDEIESAGELATFELDKNGKAKRIRCGATYSDTISFLK